MVLDFGLLDSNLFPQSDASGQGMSADINSQIVWNDVGIGIVPIGSVVALFKSITGTPPLLPNWVECNGQTLSNGDSPLNGQVIPDLNGDNNFLRGSSTSGSTGGSETHTHTLNTTGFDAVSGANAIKITNNTTQSRHKNTQITQFT